jgi:hypothetical protein
MFKIKVVEKIKTQFCVVTFFRKSYHLWDNVKQYGGAREDADNMVPAHCTVDE